MTSSHDSAYLMRGRIVEFPNPDSTYELCDGALLIENGKVIKRCEYRNLTEAERSLTVIDAGSGLILPGFVDTHMHYAQTEVIASHGHDLLDWLNNYTFPAEAAFCDLNHASRIAAFAISEMFRNGTTSAQAFATVHEVSVEAIFAEAHRHGMRLIAGKVMMDQGAPDYLIQSPEACLAANERLIKKWHGMGRLSYAVTPRFALTSSLEQLRNAGQLAGSKPDLYIQSHIAENKSEVAKVCAAFPDRAGYLDIYDHYGLVTPRSSFAHGIYLTESEWERLSEVGASVAFCPTSNLFLGSGLFPYAKAKILEVPVSLATDVGGGTTYSMLKTMLAAYKVAHLNGYVMSPSEPFYLATRGGAKCLHLEHEIGSLEPGHAADFLIVDLAATPMLDRRVQAARSLEEVLFALMTLGDDRAIRATYVAGREVWSLAGKG